MARETILVVEDSPIELRLLTAFLREQGYRVVTAVDGEDALAKVAQDRPQLIVLDVVLPRKSGFQVCRQLKNDAGTCDIKVLLVTGKRTASDRFWGLKQGADDYLTKPFADEDLLASVERLL
jgi:twitching motility two-component system response regulator PilH